MSSRLCIIADSGMAF